MGNRDHRVQGRGGQDKAFEVVGIGQGVQLRDEASQAVSNENNGNVRILFFYNIVDELLDVFVEFREPVHVAPDAAGHAAPAMVGCIKRYSLSFEGVHQVSVTAGVLSYSVGDEDDRLGLFHLPALIEYSNLVLG